MISAEMLEYLEQTVRAIRYDEHDDKKDLPFGGIQVAWVKNDAYCSIWD